MIYGETPVIYFHHVVSVTGLLYYSFKIPMQPYVVYALGLAEVTNPLLQLRWFLKYYNKRDGLLFKVIEVPFMSMFLFIRVIVLSVHLYQVSYYEAFDFTADDLIFATLGCLAGYALSYQMVGYILHQIKKNK